MKSQKHELKLKSESSNPWVTSSNLQVTSSNPRAMSSNPRVASSNPLVTSFNPRVTSWNLQVTSSNPQIIKSMKIQVSSLKSSSFLKIVSPKLFSNSRGNSYVHFLVIICFTFPPLRFHHSQGFSKRLSE